MSGECLWKEERGGILTITWRMEVFWRSHEEGRGEEECEREMGNGLYDAGYSIDW